MCVIGPGRRLALRLQIRSLPSHHILWIDSQTLQCGSVGQRSICVFVWFSHLFSSLGIFSLQQGVGTNGWTVGPSHWSTHREEEISFSSFGEINHPKKSYENRSKLASDNKYSPECNAKTFDVSLQTSLSSQQLQHVLVCCGTTNCLPVPPSGNHKAARIGAELNRFQLHTLVQISPPQPPKWRLQSVSEWERECEKFFLVDTRPGTSLFISEGLG